MFNKKAMLLKHHERYNHTGSPRYLKYGELPQAPIYSNFEAFLKNSTVDLKWREDGIKKCIGRPSKANHHPGKENKVTKVKRDPAKPYKAPKLAQTTIGSLLGKRGHFNCQFDEAEMEFQMKTIKLEFGRN